jgi:hypothetical protein
MVAKSGIGRRDGSQVSSEKRLMTHGVKPSANDVAAQRRWQTVSSLHSSELITLVTQIILVISKSEI